MLFQHLETGERELFFRNVADDVNWKVMGTHPLAGTYNTKQEFITSTFDRLDRLMKGNTILKFKNALVQGENAAVELEAASTALNGMPFNGTYCWVVKFKDGLIIEVRAYVDSALVKKVIDENE
ncbi:MAG: ketosteroid isomerase [Methanobacterium sp.]|nr:ketosteroid isomerase [Methanobacterium sp.]